MQRLLKSRGLTSSPCGVRWNMRNFSSLFPLARAPDLHFHTAASTHLCLRGRLDVESVVAPACHRVMKAWRFWIIGVSAASRWRRRRRRHDEGHQRPQLRRGRRLRRAAAARPTHVAHHQSAGPGPHAPLQRPCPLWCLPPLPAHPTLWPSSIPPVRSLQFGISACGMT